MKSLKVLIVGRGATGLLYGAWLQKGGAQVSFFARTPRDYKDAITLEGPKGSNTISGMRTFTFLPANETFDVIIYTVRHYDLLNAAQMTAAALKPAGCVLGLQNGVSTWAILSSVFSVSLRQPSST